MSRRNRDVLLIINLISHRTGRPCASHGKPPEQCSGSRVESIKISFPAASEQQIRRGGQNSTVADIMRLEFPKCLSSMWIEREYSTVSTLFGPSINGSAANTRHWRFERPSHESPARLVFSRCTQV